jgi:hypothetical protein
MGRDQTTQTFKLQILALVLALALLWYSINPAPIPASRGRSEGDVPDEKRRELEPERHRGGYMPLDSQPFEIERVASTAPIKDEEEFEWPEFIDA